MTWKHKSTTQTRYARKTTIKTRNSWWHGSKSQHRKLTLAATHKSTIQIHLEMGNTSKKHKLTLTGKAQVDNTKSRWQGNTKEQHKMVMMGQQIINNANSRGQKKKTTANSRWQKNTSATKNYDDRETQVNTHWLWKVNTNQQPETDDDRELQAKHTTSRWQRNTRQQLKLTMTGILKS